MVGKTSAALRRRKSLDAFIAEEMRNPDFRIHFHEARAKSDIAHALVQARKRAGLTQAQVARRARTTQPVIGRLEGGTLRMPSLPLIHRVARAVGMQLSDHRPRPSFIAAAAPAAGGARRSTSRSC